MHILVLHCGLANEFQGIVSNSSSKKEFTDNDPHLCVIVRTHEGHALGLMPLMQSLLVSHYRNIQFWLLDTSSTFTGLPTIANIMNVIYNRYSKAKK